jgi:hypothetical protein
MNYIKHLTGFFERVSQDKTLNPTHVSLYIALFQFWNCNRFKNPISISRDEVMRISKISSKATYHKCLKNLHALGYIKYEPSYNPFRGSHVIMFNFAEDLKPQPKTSSKNEPFFEPVSEQVVNEQKASDEQVLAPSINNTNISNNKNESKHTHSKSNKIENEESVLKNSVLQEKEKGSAEKEKEKKATDDLILPGAAEVSLPINFHKPSLEEILNYFTRQEFETTEAQKFYNYYQSNGWLIGGKATMADWQAAAQTWMSKTLIFNQKPTTIQSQKPNLLNTETNKNYAEPL